MERGIPFESKLAATFNDGWCDLCRRWGGIWEPLPTKVIRDLLQISIVAQLHEVHHLRKGAPAVAEVDHLVEQVSGWLARYARIVAIRGGPTDFAMTYRARPDTPCHEVLFRYRRFSATYAAPCREEPAQQRCQECLP